MGKEKRSLASKADKYDLYQRSVQAPEADVEFFDKAYRKTFKRTPSLLREDFCGTALTCCEWVKMGSERIALGVDLDPEPIAWGKKNNLSKLSTKKRKRIKLVEADVRKTEGPKADIVAAQNFSYLIFHTRESLKEYFKAAYKNLGNEGILILDLMGGPEVWKEDRSDKTKHKGFVYRWEHARFDPITHRCKFHIHYSFKDGSARKKAFTYDWRLWTIPELREILVEAGFSRADVYWEGVDSKGEGDGKYVKRESAPSDPCWISYIVGVKAEAAKKETAPKKAAKKKPAKKKAAKKKPAKKKAAKKKPAKRKPAKKKAAKKKTARKKTA